MANHTPVLLKETLDVLHVEQGKKYIDATLGLGGHTLEILKAGGTVLGIDVNAESIDKAQEQIDSSGLSANFLGIQGNFKDIETIAQANNFSHVSGILYDLGYSSFELEDTELGLSFTKDRPLDMRLDQTLNVTAADLLNSLPEDQLKNIIYNYSGDKLAGKFAKAIVSFRNKKKFETTKQLADLLKSETSFAYEQGRINPATRTFQALRIAVNDELENLRLTLPRAARLLLPSGVLVIISFHSLEDRVAKQFGHDVQPKLTEVFKKPLTPTQEEISVNPRARSAKLRAFKNDIN
jgi:16S rRNA (cytosine1402-N4)-methyltransferase